MENRLLVQMRTELCYWVGSILYILCCLAEVKLSRALLSGGNAKKCCCNVNSQCLSCLWEDMLPLPSVRSTSKLGQRLSSRPAQAVETFAPDTGNPAGHSLTTAGLPAHTVCACSDTHQMAARHLTPGLYTTTTDNTWDVWEVFPKENSKRNRLSLNNCLSHTEIFSKRRKIYT